MARKILYSLIAISFVIVINQISGGQGTTATGTTSPTSTVASFATGVVEVRVSASAASAEITSAKLTVSSVEIHVPDGWSKMKMEDTNTVDLKQVEGLEQTIATTSLNHGTYTQIRVSIASLDVALGSSQPKKAKLSASMLSFTQNFQVTTKNTTVLVFNFDALKSIDYSLKDQITFNPLVNLLFTRTPGSMELVTTNLPQGEVGIAYYGKLMAIGGQRPYSWSITMGDPPPGLNLDTITGVISGTPTIASTFNFLVRVDDASPAGKTTNRNYRVGIAENGALQIVTGSLPDGSEKVAYNTKLQAIGATQPYTWSVSGGSLPSGLTLDSNLGIISGIATVKGDFSFVVKVMENANPANTDTQSLNIRIAPEVVAR